MGQSEQRILLWMINKDLRLLPNNELKDLT